MSDLDLGFPKPRAKTRVVAAMSGGVDSAVTAALLKQAGYDVVGVTLQLYDHGAAVRKVGACCAGQDIHDARRAAEMLGIPHYVLDYESRFREAVMDDFADSYLAGETPIPCVKCNQTVKFKDLRALAQDLGADALATGHYVRRELGPDGAELHRGADPSRDQSYFLFATTREQLDYLRFPIGHLPKDRVRALAVEFGLKIAAKPDSQDICFVPNGKYQSVVEKLRPGAIEPGEIVHVDGRVLGRHNGVINFTTDLSQQKTGTISAQAVNSNGSTSTTLIGGGNNNRVLEVDRKGKIVWSVDQKELPGVTLAWVTTLHVLPSGNVIIGNTHAGAGQPQLIEVNRDKKVVWRFEDHRNFGNDLAAVHVLGLPKGTLR